MQFLITIFLFLLTITDCLNLVGEKCFIKRLFSQCVGLLVKPRNAIAQHQQRRAWRLRQDSSRLQHFELQHFNTLAGRKLKSGKSMRWPWVTRLKRNPISVDNGAVIYTFSVLQDFID